MQYFFLFRKNSKNICKLKFIGFSEIFPEHRNVHHNLFEMFLIQILYKVRAPINRLGLINSAYNSHINGILTVTNWMGQSK